MFKLFLSFFLCLSLRHRLDLTLLLRYQLLFLPSFICGRLHFGMRLSYARHVHSHALAMLFARTLHARSTASRLDPTGFHVINEREHICSQIVPLYRYLRMRFPELLLLREANASEILEFARHVQDDCFIGRHLLLSLRDLGDVPRRFLERVSGWNC